MRVVPIGLALSCFVGCRIGFDIGEDGGYDKPVAIDATLGVDSPPGSGSYAINDGTAPYVGLGDAGLIEGFAPGDDDDNYTVTIPFAFPFFRVSYDAITVNVNGYVTFTTPATGAETADNDCAIDGSLPDAMIAVFWDDLFASAIRTPFGLLATATDGVSPARTFTIEWREIDAWYAQGSQFWSQTMRATQKLVLHETGMFELHYGPRFGGVKDRDCGVDRHRGCSATIGIEGAGGSPVQLVQCGTALGGQIRYTPIDEGRLLTFSPL